ncbi:unnamed protein product [Callosobruchus maculatus]|uniref:EGF-like domain-containing protein n=1 Tax=Callosobruchus maculatus TaxID=64391 RepID=A0A653DXF2_CALMS|nr:unnamed protein product [Callosobruchus maculatus]
MEWRLTGPGSGGHHLGFLPLRGRRDVRDATKYIETALVIDKAMFEKRNGSTRMDVVHDSIQVANIADLYFRTLNTRVSVVYIETWQGGNQATIDRNEDIGKALSNFNDYTARKLFKVDKDTTQLLTGEVFAGGEAGMAVPATVCTTKSVGISVDINTYEPHLLAGTMAHMIECSRSDYIDRLRTGNGICLLNKPNELTERRTCGNSIVEEGEDCDCGSIDNCHNVDPCCDPITCKLTKEARCASGPCCEGCQLKEKGVICREASNECDLPEQCSGDTGECPADVYKKNGSPCAKGAGYCFNGVCPTLTLQCEHIWGYGGIAADDQCFEQFNSKGSINGHCGSDSSGRLVKCAPENVRCGSLQCQLGNRYPVVEGLDQPQDHSRTIISIKGHEYECKSIHRTTTVKKQQKSSTGSASDVPHLGLVRDGTPCGENLICINQTCTSIFPHIMQEKCPSNQGSVECSGHGYCTNQNKCYCELGWTGTDCSIQMEMTPPPPLPTPPADISPTNLQDHMKKKETPYESYHGSNTIFLVGTLMSVVGGVFVVFATMALCYRSVVVHKNFSLCLSRADSQRVLFRPSNHMSVAAAGSGGPSQFQDHKMQQLKRMGVGSSEEDGLHTVTDLQANNLKMPGEKKGILKKQDFNLMGWVDNVRGEGVSSAAADDIMTQAEESIAHLMAGPGAQALRVAASHRGSATPSGASSAAGLSEELLRRSIAQCAAGDGYPEYKRSSSKENVCEQQVVIEHVEEDEDEVPPCGPIRIRNLEDLIRQLEHHSRHMSPSGSEDIRMSETEADRHYRQESSSACSESSHQSHHRESRFVYGGSGRYHRTGAGDGSSGSRGSVGRLPMGYHPAAHHVVQDEESIYETADHDRGEPCGDTPDSESDDFIQAQQQLSRWASDDGVSVAGASGSGVPSSGTAGGAVPREYYPSPSSSTSEEPPSIARAPHQLPPGPPPRPRILITLLFIGPNGIRSTNTDSD